MQPVLNLSGRTLCPERQTAGNSMRTRLVRPLTDADHKRTGVRPVLIHEPFHGIPARPGEFRTRRNGTPPGPPRQAVRTRADPPN